MGLKSDLWLLLFDFVGGIGGFEMFDQLICKDYKALSITTEIRGGVSSQVRL